MNGNDAASTCWLGTCSRKHFTTLNRKEKGECEWKWVFVFLKDMAKKVISVGLG